MEYILLLFLIFVFVFVYCSKHTEYFGVGGKRHTEYFGNASLEHQAKCLQQNLAPETFKKIISAHQKEDGKSLMELSNRNKKADWYLSKCRFANKEGQLESHYKMSSGEKQKIMTQAAILHEDFDGNDHYDNKIATLKDGFLEPFCGNGKFKLTDKYGCCKRKYGTNDWPGYSQCILTGEGMSPC